MSKFPIKQFQVRTAIRNCWAHCNVIQWDIAKFCVSFQLLESFFKNLHLNATEENRVIGDLHNCKTNGKLIDRKNSAQKF